MRKRTHEKRKRLIKEGYKKVSSERTIEVSRINQRPAKGDENEEQGKIRRHSE